MNLTQKLRVLRNQSGLSQADLAEQADVSRQPKKTHAMPEAASYS